MISHRNAVAEHQICQNQLRGNANNLEYLTLPNGTRLRVDSVDPTRPQDNSPDPSIHYGDVDGVPYCASYNAELFKQLTPTMASVLAQTSRF